MKLQKNRFYSLKGLRKKAGKGTKVQKDCSFIILTNDKWDNDMVLYIVEIGGTWCNPLYRVAEAN